MVKPPRGSLTLDTTPIFSWKSVAGAFTYYLTVSPNRDLSSPVINALPLVGLTSYTPTTPLARGNWHWQITTDNGKVMASWGFTIGP
jgi:hypothetical protein